MSNFISSAFQAHFKRGYNHSRFVSWLVAVVFITATAYGVHILHKKALAETIIYTVYLHDGNDPITDEHCDVHISFYDAEGIVQGDPMEYQQTGIWTCNISPETTWTHWRVTIEDWFQEWDVVPVDPDESPSPPMDIWGGGAQNYLDWEAELIPIP